MNVLQLVHAYVCSIKQTVLAPTSITQIAKTIIASYSACYSALIHFPWLKTIIRNLNYKETRYLAVVAMTYV